jgi:hypothetical protein
MRTTKTILNSHERQRPATTRPEVGEKVLDQLRERIRDLHYSIRTGDVHVYWVRTSIRFHRLRYSASMGGGEVGAFLPTRGGV